MKFYKYFSYTTISLVRFSVLILDKLAMGSLNVDYTARLISLNSHGSPVFDPTFIIPPDYSVLSPFANNGGY